MKSLVASAVVALVLFWKTLAFAENSFSESGFDLDIPQVSLRLPFVARSLQEVISWGGVVCSAKSWKEAHERWRQFTTTKEGMRRAASQDPNAALTIEDDNMVLAVGIEITLVRNQRPSSEGFNVSNSIFLDRNEKELLKAVETLALKRSGFQAVDKIRVRIENRQRIGMPFKNPRTALVWEVFLKKGGLSGECSFVSFLAKENELGVRLRKNGLSLLVADSVPFENGEQWISVLTFISGRYDQ